MLGESDLPSSSWSMESIWSQICCWLSERFGLSTVKSEVLVCMMWFFSLGSIFYNHFSQIMFMQRGVSTSSAGMFLPLNLSPRFSREEL